MSKFCPLANAVTNCTDNCTACLREELKEKVEALEYITSGIDTMIDTRKGGTQMKRLGKFTKTIYDENYDFSNCPECCAVITDEQASDEEFINKHHIKDLMNCVTCMGCPASQR